MENILPEPPKKKDYFLRDVPRDLWDEAKKKAIDEGTSLRVLVLRAVREYVNKN